MIKLLIVALLSAIAGYQLRKLVEFLYYGKPEFPKVKEKQNYDIWKDVSK